MLWWRSEPRDGRWYSLAEVAEFTEFDMSALEYWLRMGHLPGEWDAKAQEWRIRPEAIIEFLRQANEPMPTGARDRALRELAPESASAA